MSTTKDQSIRVLELYSGIGGMHFALLQAVQGATVVAAVDISPLANVVYRHVFPDTLQLEKGIEGLSAKELDKLNFNLLLMSPPCQPFTRLGAKKDMEDPRTKSFLYLLEVLKKIKNPPMYILLENVHGFEKSHTFSAFSDVLDKLSYHQQGFLISPKLIGIPNSRLRYYHLAVRKPHCFSKQWFDPVRILEFLPYSAEVNAVKESKNSFNPPKCMPLTAYLEDTNSDSDEFIVPAKVIKRYLPVMDVVTPLSTNSTCFTKSYGHYAEGTGSILDVSASGREIFSGKDNLDFSKLRYFTPREISNLMGFPKNGFSFPSQYTTKQQYKLLGNSLNVHVVAKLIKLLVYDLQLK